VSDHHVRHCKCRVCRVLAIGDNIGLAIVYFAVAFVLYHIARAYAEGKLG
jgi:hypothetical protein